ncbi:hypothetical protein BKG91_09345 [Rodentibacter caecimuris]|uniref:Uncharacterized protein n=1 Tax=Rodentibacter caecimuris TaxID=1796644 RepID=A0A9X8W0E0_9PAST|nr:MULTISPECIES: hypothetical protein [Pasteurellaceae]AOF54425.1 phage-related protein [Pasteurellaceae bacterium NI1060]MCR1838546.1 hypothetical protein [Pasteurella caecimuris]MCU0107857.1 hypothetical protein [Pasteurella caecimuris]OOF72388.1 hypothetical protein BKG90_04675 [Rodentibacter heylii]OOF73347.1 hypothetical protein BKG91_09345 [Rodentibacter heylii]
MRVRRLDKNHDWTFGQGFVNYASESEAIAQNVQTRLLSFANDWFLDLNHGLPWLEQMGHNVNLSDWEIRIKRHVLQTEGVIKITEYESIFDPDTRQLKITISYQDIYGQQQTARYDV